MSLSNRTIKRRVFLAGAVSAFGVGLAAIGLPGVSTDNADAVALAQPAATLTARPAAGLAGVLFRFRGQGFAPNEVISTVVRWPEGNDESDVLFEADINGNVDFAWNSTGAAPGRYQMTATGTTSGLRASVSFSIQGPPPPPAATPTPTGV